MKKGMKLLTVSLSIGLSLTALVGTAVLSKTIRSLANDLPNTLDCAYFFNEENGYTSIYEMNNDLFSNNVQSSYKTWGTVTEAWMYNGSTNTYIQSTDKNGHPAAICLYNCNTPVDSFPIGSVLEVTVAGSDLTIYNNMPEIKDNAVISKIYFENPSPVITEDVTYIWDDGDTMTSQYYQALAPFGPIREKIYDASITYVSNKQATVTLSSGQSATLYYSNVGAGGATSTQIRNRLNTFYNNNQKVTIFGYVNPFKNSTGTSGNLQLLLRNVYDIVPSSFYDDSAIIQSIELSAATTTEYNVGQEFVSPVLQVKMRDGTFDVNVDSSCTGYDMAYEGTYYVTVNYTYSFGGTSTTFSLSDFYSVTVSNGGEVKTPVSLDIITAFSKTDYEVGDAFEEPDVYVNYSDGTDECVTYQCVYTGYDLSQPGTYTVTVTYYYSGGSLSGTYEITVIQGSTPTLTGLNVDNPKTEYTVGDTFEEPDVYAIYSNGSSSYVTYSCTFIGYDMWTTGTQTVYVSYQGISTSYQITVSAGGQSGDYTINTNSMISFSGSKYYSTGNFGNTSIGGYSFEYYRAIKNYSGVVTLLKCSSQYGEHHGGALYNTSAIENISKIEITYSNGYSSTGDDNYISYGQNNFASSQVIEYSTSSSTVTINTPENTNYFKIESSVDADLDINELKITYSDDSTGSTSFVETNAYTNSYRVNPNKYTGTLVAGSTSVTVPTKVSYSGNRYTVLQSKTYTYYTLDYVSTHSSSMYDAAMTDPVDVANYFSIFGKIPANYGGGDNTVNEVKNVFGSSLTRQVSYYSRTDGYATSIPNVNASSGYYEFDIDVDGTYSTSSRGIGRVVAWIYGINNSNYGNGSYAVCDFTDDHYATFQEFNNLGEFLPKFDAERKIVAKKWSAPNTAYAA